MLGVFPAHAGMSLFDLMPLIKPLSFPRSRGDEPQVWVGAD